MTEPSKQQFSDFSDVKTELAKKGTLAGTIERGPQDEWLGMVYELNSDYESPEEQNHFAKLVFNGSERI